MYCVLHPVFELLSGLFVSVGNRGGGEKVKPINGSVDQRTTSQHNFTANRQSHVKEKNTDSILLLTVSETTHLVALFPIIIKLIFPLVSSLSVRQSQ